MQCLFVRQLIISADTSHSQSGRYTSVFETTFIAYFLLKTMCGRTSSLVSSSDIFLYKLGAIAP
ncbi:hypothetical protein IQ270_02175 [Microcoleus sp. LEGE 07076]|uniref:hypothetical protein n=1 Tax=Microcoleus sp. LEGE 07076 TaxID=915322 RepID=UPI00188158CF|nr:hypothetical protein [Microcoleus sp. LEGE 07076]MBE9183562.1 hypothetical protein [Microcoleus sp. LEGE 07076]